MPRTPEDIFHDAREIADPAERLAFLDDACGGDKSLRARVDALLAADAEAGSFLKTAHPHDPARDPDATETMSRVHRGSNAPAEQAGQVIDRYKLLQQIGEGGFGTVWMAEQKTPVKRRVALKVIKLGMDTKLIIARFDVERQALAMMDHPNIAKVFDAGATETGRPYFVMELVRGIPILEYCDTEKLDTKARLKLFILVCNAIQHAHQKGIIHRDIKPSNVLVTLHDGEPVPKVIDFGIAKATNQELTQQTLYTEFNQMIGTPAYMSPEQAEMSGLDIDTRADIYSLGVLLYELLTGTTPFDHKELMQRGFAEMMRIIREETPHKPSTRLSTLGETAARTAEQRHTDLKKLGLVLRGDLDWIVMRCLEKNRTRRYDTATSLAADINRHLSDEPVEAGPPSAAYKVRKFVRRNKGLVVASSVVAVTLLLGIVGTSIGLWAAQYNAKVAINNAQIAQSARDDLSKANTTLVQQTDEAEWSSYTANLALAQMAMDNGNWPEARARLAQCPESKRGWEWDFLSSKARSVEREIPGSFAKYSINANKIMTLTNNNKINIWDNKGILISNFIDKGNSTHHFVFSLDGHGILTIANDQRVRVWNQYGKLISQLGQHDGWIHSAAIANINSNIVLMESDGTVWVQDAGGHDVYDPIEQSVFWGSLQVNASGNFVTTDSLDDRYMLRIYNAYNGHVKSISYSSPIHFASFSADGNYFSSISTDHTVQIWSADGDPIGQPLSHDTVVKDVFFAPDNSKVLTCTVDNRLHLWNLSGHLIGDNLRHDFSTDTPLFLNKEEILTSYDGVLQLWNAQQHLVSIGEIPIGDVSPLAILDGGNAVLCRFGGPWWQGGIGKTCIIPFPLKSPVHTIGESIKELYFLAELDPDKGSQPNESELQAVAFAPSATSIATLSGGSRIVTAAADSTVRFWDPKTEKELAAIPMGAGVTNLTFTPDGTRLVIELDDGSARIFDTRSAEEQAADVQRRWAEREPAGAYLDTLMAGPTLTADLLAAVETDSSFTPLRRLAAAEVLAERLADIRAHAARAFAAITQDQTDTAAVLAAAKATDLPRRVKEQVLTQAEAWEYEPPKK